MSGKRKLLVYIGSGLLVLIAGTAWVLGRRAPVLREVAVDLRAGVQARHTPDPFSSFLEIRYGPQTEAVNREKAFIAFFDPTHVQGMHQLVRYMKPVEREKNIAATAQWIASYRQKMSSEEKRALAEWVRSEEGRANVQRASSLYRSRDIHFRAASEPVIFELMTTLASLEKNGPR